MSMCSKPFRMVTRKKVLIVAYTGKNFDKLLMVRDSKTGEWASPGGGQKRSEKLNLLSPSEREFITLNKIDPNAYVAAERELAEETSGLFTKFKSAPETFTFTTYYRPPELLRVDNTRHEVVRSLYTVFLYKIPHFHVSLNNFVPNKEVNAIKIAPFHEFSNVWCFFKDFYTRILSNHIKKKNYYTYNGANYSSWIQHQSVPASS